MIKTANVQIFHLFSHAQFTLVRDEMEITRTAGIVCQEVC